MLKIKKGDTVIVMKGDDKGKKGKVLSVHAEKNKVIIEGVNFVKKHRRQTRQDQQGGIVSIESPLAIANVRLICKHCNSPAKVGLKVLPDGTKERLCKTCQEVI
jgi:large subunit ribosomal protein L24